MQQTMENEDAWRDLLRTLGAHQRAFNDQLVRLNAQTIVPNVASSLLGPIKRYSASVPHRKWSFLAFIFRCSALEGITAAVFKESGLIRENTAPESERGDVKKFTLKFVKADSEKNQAQAYVSQVSAAMDELKVCPLTDICSTYLTITVRPHPLHELHNE